MFGKLRARVYATLSLITVLLVGAGWVVFQAISRVHAPGEPEIGGFILVVSVFALALSIVLGEALVRSLLLPVRDLNQVVSALAKGDQAARARNAHDDELGELARTIDRMAAQFGARFDAMSAEEAQLRTILDAMVEAVFVTDREGRIILTNAALLRLAGARVDGRTAVEAIRSPDLHEAVTLGLRGVESSVQIETRLLTEPRVLAAHVSPLPQGSGVVVVLHDVTDLKLADTVRRDFVANASHELRTPLTAIRGFAETLANGGVQDPQLVSRFVGRILEHSVRLQRLVDDLMQLSRAEAPDETFVVEPVDLASVVARAMRGLEASASLKRIRLVTDHAVPGLRVLADERALDHVLVNLIDNGVKYTPEDGTVTVRSSVDEGAAIIEVADTGGGIAATHLSRIFERFYRVDPGRSRDVGGTGLGLAIVKHLTQRMGGEVSVDSKVGQGTVFRVKLRISTSLSG